MNTNRNVVPALAGLIASTIIVGCGPKAEEPDVVAVPPAQNKIVIENTVQVPVANKAANVVVVKPQVKQQTTVVNNRTTVVPAAIQKPKLPAPAPPPTRTAANPAPTRAIARTAPTASWKPVPPPGPRSGAPVKVAKAPAPFKKITPAPAAAAVPVTIKGQIVAVSKIPDINSAPYQEALVYVKYKVLSVESGSYNEMEVMAAHWGMQKKKLTPAAAYKVGQTHRLELVPMSSRTELERVMTWNTLNDFELTPYFVTKVG